MGIKSPVLLMLEQETLCLNTMKISYLKKLLCDVPQISSSLSISIKHDIF